MKHLCALTTCFAAWLVDWPCTPKTVDRSLSKMQVFITKYLRGCPPQKPNLAHWLFLLAGIYYWSKHIHHGTSVLQPSRWDPWDSVSRMLLNVVRSSLSGSLKLVFLLRLQTWARQDGGTYKTLTKIVQDIRQTGTRSDRACSLSEGVMISSHTSPPSILGLPHYSPTNPFCPLTTCRAAWYVGRPWAPKTVHRSLRCSCRWCCGGFGLLWFILPWPLIFLKKS